MAEQTAPVLLFTMVCERKRKEFPPFAVIACFSSVQISAPSAYLETNCVGIEDDA